MRKLSPAEYVIKMFGGVRPTSRLFVKSASNISRWQNYCPKTNPKGTIPSKYHRSILEKAAELNIDITPRDLIYGREVQD